MIDYIEIGKRVRYYRLKRNYTQEKLAFEIQSSAAYVSNVERARKKPSLQKLLQIAQALEVSVSELVSVSPDSTDGMEKTSPDRKRLVNTLYEIISILENDK